MNLSPDLSTGSAVLMGLFAASLWGTWAISLKYLEDYPLDGFILTVFATSIVFVWSAGLLLEGRALLANIQHILENDPIRIGGTLLGGIIYVSGIRFSLIVVQKIGLSLMQPIHSSISVLVGTLGSALIGGVPAGVSFPRIMLAALVLVGAVMASMLAGHFRSNSPARPAGGRGMNASMDDMWKALGLVVIGSLFIPAYPLALSFGLRSTTHPEGLAVLPFMALLATGAFVGALLTSGIVLTTTGQWRRVLVAPASIHKWGVGSGLFHYGGNILHTFATAQLSSAVTWPLGVSGGFWTQLWGLLYGELEGAPRRAYVALFSALFLYVLGVYLIATTL
jgi:hypothetical protein